MKLLDWLKGLFTKRPNITIVQESKQEQVPVIFPKEFAEASSQIHSEEEDVTLPTSLGDITFSILDDGRIHISCHWANKYVAPAYGELMYKLNNGDLTGDIIDTLLGRLPQHPQEATVIQEIIDYWKMIKDNEENQPLISPSSVFAMEQPEMQMPPNMEEME